MTNEEANKLCELMVRACEVREDSYVLNKSKSRGRYMKTAHMAAVDVAGVDHPLLWLIAHATYGEVGDDAREHLKRDAARKAGA
jgi:hypothetical protein